MGFYDPSNKLNHSKCVDVIKLNEKLLLPAAAAARVSVVTDNPKHGEAMNRTTITCRTNINNAITCAG